MAKLKKNISIGAIIRISILSLWSLLVLLPLWIMIINSFKARVEIYRSPLNLPTSFDFSGYLSVFQNSSFLLYFLNSIIITFASIALILLVTSLASYAIVRWKNRIASLLSVFFLAGLLIPLRIGSIYLLQLSKTLRLIDSFWSLLPIYVSMGIPIGVLVLTELIRRVPTALYDAARIDGASRFGTYLRILLPLIQPGLATVAIIHIVLFWNDLWFPLILIQNESQRTLMLGISHLFGQYQTNWTRILATLTLGSFPVVIVYVLMSRQFIAGLTAGAIKE